jgi:nitric-oxide synthase
MLIEKAKYFIQMMHQELNIDASTTNKRIQEIKDEINQTGTYTHTTEELNYGAKTAWRQSNRCIGRLFWHSLEVRDLRHIDNEDTFIKSVEKHIEDTTNDGKIKPMISIYSNNIKIHNEQLIRYAGYEHLGDPQSIPSTQLASHLGWNKDPDDFNILPLIYQFPGQPTKYHELPKGIIKEIEIQHEDYPKLKSLGLRWYAVPIISNMDLEIGGIYYHTAPFNGWYMESEIGVRNFTDEYRYNKLPEIAEAFNLDTTKTTTYWRDRALVEFNYAVYHSFKNEGVAIVDHITASKQFKQFELQEEKANRHVTGKWSWLAPPLSPSLVHNYHHGYDNTMRTPNFFYRKKERKCPFH